MPGKATRPDDGRRKNPGGYRGGGRPRLTDPSESKARKIHQVRAYDNEWELIKAFISCTRQDDELCQKVLSQLMNEIKQKQERVAKEAIKMRPPTTADKIQKAKELSSLGKTQTEIAALLGITNARVSQMLNSGEGKESRISAATLKKIDEIKELSELGLTQSAIAEHLGLSQSRVSQLMKMS